MTTFIKFLKSVLKFLHLGLERVENTAQIGQTGPTKLIMAINSSVDLRGIHDVVVETSEHYKEIKIIYNDSTIKSIFI